MSELYNHKVVEKKWQKVWDDNKAFAATDDYSKPKYYALVEFPVSVRTGTARRTSETVHGTRYCGKKAPYAGIQCTLSDGMGCIWSADRELCDQE